MRQPVELIVWVLGTTLLVSGALWFAVRCIRWAKQGTKGGALLATIAFPTPEQPSPQQQIEEERLRKQASESGDPPS